MGHSNGRKWPAQYFRVIGASVTARSRSRILPMQLTHLRMTDLTKEHFDQQVTQLLDRIATKDDVDKHFIAIEKTLDGHTIAPDLPLGSSDGYSQTRITILSSGHPQLVRTCIKAHPKKEAQATRTCRFHNVTVHSMPRR